MRLPDYSRLSRKRRAEPQLTRPEALAARPLRNPAIDWELQDNGLVLLTVPLELKPWMRMVRAVVHFPTERRVELDEVGSDVWQWADGQATVEELVGRMTAKHRLNAREAEVSLTQFLQTLAKRRFMAFAVELDDERAEELRPLMAKTATEPQEDS